MLWHLVSPDGHIVRSADADSLAEARFRLAPILPSHSVISAASHANSLPQHAPTPAPKKVRRTHYGPTHWGVNDIRRRTILAANVEGISDAAIGREVGTTAEAVSQVRKKMGLPSVERRREMQVRAYWTLGWPDRRIAKRLGTRQQTVIRMRQRLGLPSHQSRGGFTKARQATIKGFDYAV